MYVAQTYLAWHPAWPIVPFGRNSGGNTVVHYSKTGALLTAFSLPDATNEGTILGAEFAKPAPVPTPPAFLLFGFRIGVLGS